MKLNVEKLVITFDENGPDDQVIQVRDGNGRDLTFSMTQEQKSAVGTAVAIWLLENGIWSEEDRGHGLVN